MKTAAKFHATAFVVATALFGLAAVAGVRPQPSTTLLVLLAGVVLLGLPHGALDPRVAAKAFSSGGGRYSAVAFHAVYLAVVLAYGLLWSRFPTVGLTIFLLIASFHFGSDWQPRGNALTRLAYGLSVVALPSLLHPAEVEGVYAALGTTHAPLLVAVSRVLAPVAVAVAGAAAALRIGKSNGDLLEFTAIVTGALLLQPLLFFSCYFCLLHSPRHLLETSEALGITSLRGIVATTLPVVIATILLGGGVYLLLPPASWGGRVLTVVFVGLASLTVPHMVLEAMTHGPAERTADRMSL